jgi:hypothetical protein
MLVREQPPLTAFDDTRWAQVARYSSVPLIESLELLRLQRKELVTALRALDLSEWERTGIHEARGTLTVMQVARDIAEHDEEHCAQIEQSAGE